MTEITTSATQTGDIAAKKEDEVEFTAPGMGSNRCAGLITTSLERLPGSWESKPISQPTSAEREVRLTVPDKESDHCGGLVSAYIRRLPGIVDIGANIASHRVTVQFEADKVEAKAIGEPVDKAGYTLAVIDEARSATIMLPEPSLEELLLDPIVRQLMRSDSVSEAHVRDIVSHLREWKAFHA